MSGSPVSPNVELRHVAEVYTAALRKSLRERLVSVVLFGSVARGDAENTSDIDLIIVVEGLPSSAFERHRSVHEADASVAADLARLRRRGIFGDVRPILKTPDEASRPTPLYFDLTEDAVLLYDAAGFFRKVLEEVRASLRRLGAQRVHRDGVRYWDLKPDYRPGDVFELWPTFRGQQ